MLRIKFNTKLTITPPPTLDVLYILYNSTAVHSTRLLHVGINQAGANNIVNWLVEIGLLKEITCYACNRHYRLVSEVV
jgi:hypothetical protein